MKKLLTDIRKPIDVVNEWTGRIVAWLLIPLTIIVTMEVTARYVFNKPTIWAWDVNVQLLGALAVLGGGYTLLHKGHIAVDVVVSGFPPRTRAIIDLVTSPIFFFAYGVLFWLAIGEAKFSYDVQEIWTTLFEPLIWPIRTVIVLGVFLLMMQGLVKVIRDLRIATRSGGEGMP